MPGRPPLMDYQPQVVSVGAAGTVPSIGVDQVVSSAGVGTGSAGTNQVVSFERTGAVFAGADQVVSSETAGTVSTGEAEMVSTGADQVVSMATVSACPWTCPAAKNPASMASPPAATMRTVREKITRTPTLQR